MGNIRSSVLHLVLLLMSFGLSMTFPDDVPELKRVPIAHKSAEHAAEGDLLEQLWFHVSAVAELGDLLARAQTGSACACAARVKQAASRAVDAWVHEAKALLAHGAQPARARCFSSPALVRDLVPLPPSSEELYLPLEVFTTGESLHAAAVAGDGNSLRRQLATGADAETRTQNGDTLLHVAACHGHLDALSALLEAGARPGVRGHKLRSPLHEAATHGHLDVAEMLLGTGAPVDATDADGVTPIMAAARIGHSQVVLLLQREGANADFLNAEGETLLIRSIQRGDWNETKILIKNGASLTFRGANGDSPLLLAARIGKTDIIEMMMSRGTVCDAEEVARAVEAAGNAATVWALANSAPDIVRGRAGEQGLCRVAEDCEQDVLMAFLAAGVSPDSRNKENKSAILLAAANVHMACVKALREYDAKPLRGSMEEEVLCQAAQNARLDVLQALITAGINANGLNKDNKSAILLAAEGGHTEVVKFLLLNGAHSLVGVEGRDAMTKAIKTQNSNVMQALLASGFDANKKNADGETPLNNAAKENCLQCLEDLLTAGADVNSLDTKGESALHEAAFYGHTESIQFLLRTGAHVNVEDQAGESSLHEAAFNGHTECVIILLEAGEDINRQDKFGETSLNKAAFMGHKLTIIVLLEKGADVNATDNKGETALHKVADFGCKDCLGILLNYGAGVDARNLIDETPLHKSAYKGHTECVEILLRNGADINARNIFFETPLIKAAALCHREIIKVLIEKGAEIIITKINGKTAFQVASHSFCSKCLNDVLETEVTI